jgi:hypothetical protein
MEVLTRKRKESQEGPFTSVFTLTLPKYSFSFKSHELTWSIKASLHLSLNDCSPIRLGQQRCFLIGLYIESSLVRRSIMSCPALVRPMVPSVLRFRANRRSIPFILRRPPPVLAQLFLHPGVSAKASLQSASSFPFNTSLYLSRVTSVSRGGILMAQSSKPLASLQSSFPNFSLSHRL